jgi:hypothetical protein
MDRNQEQRFMLGYLGGVLVFFGCLTVGFFGFVLLSLEDPSSLMEILSDFPFVVGAMSLFVLSFFSGVITSVFFTGLSVVVRGDLFSCASETILNARNIEQRSTSFFMGV